MELEERVQGNELINSFVFENNGIQSLIAYDYTKSWDGLHKVIDYINGLGKEYNFSIFKTYVALSIEKDSKFFKDFHFAHSEYVTATQTSKEATFRLIVKFLKWNNDKLKEE